MTRTMDTLAIVCRALWAPTVKPILRCAKKVRSPIRPDIQNEMVDKFMFQGNERCFNGGECIEGPGLAFLCKCPMGWTGALCDVDIDDCESAPCQNGGVCIDKLAGYSCACLMGYTGNSCEEQILVCEDSPCQNSALCLMEEGMPTCYCVPDFHGEKCEYQYDECQLGPRCLHGGSCVDGVDEFSCSCTPHFSGIFCECLILSSGELDCNISSATTGFWATFQTPLAQASTTQSITHYTNFPSYTRPTGPVYESTQYFVPTSHTYTYPEPESDSQTSEIVSPGTVKAPDTEDTSSTSQLTTSQEETQTTVELAATTEATSVEEAETTSIPTTTPVEEMTTEDDVLETTEDDLVNASSHLILASNFQPKLLSSTHSSSCAKKN
jgi:protein eyes shut